MIAVIISAHSEWRAVKGYYRVEQTASTPFGEKFSRVVEGRDVLFFFGGWGKIDAAASVQHVIDVYAPEVIINLGTCGGFAGDAQVGDIILVKQTIVYDIYERISDPDEAIQAYATEIDISWIQDVADVNVIRSLLISADRDLDPAEIPLLQDKYQAIAGDWESGAIAHVCHRNNVPVAILRGVSDLVSVHEGEAYQGNGVFIQRAAMVMTTLLNILPNIIAMHRHHSMEFCREIPDLYCSKSRE